MANQTLSVKIIGDSASLVSAAKSGSTAINDLSKNAASASTGFGKLSAVGGALQSMGGSIKAVGDSLTNHITKPALIAGTALVGVTLTKGWARMTEMDTASAKLKAIGLSAKEAQQVSDDAFKAIEKSAYGMDEAMTVATTGIASGLKAGSKEFNTYMNAITGVASFAGTSMTEMGDVFGKVLAKGKASGEDLTRLAEKSVPIYQWLADEIGVSADQVIDLASKGQISYDQFAAAVEHHTEGMAEAIGSSTIQGALGFLSAGISRVGQAFLGAGNDGDTMAGKLIPLIMNVFKALDPIVKKASELGKAFAAKIDPFIQKTIDFLDRFANGALTASDKAKASFIGLGGSIAVLAGPLLSFTGSGIIGLGKLASSFAALQAPIEGLGMTMGGLAQSILPVVAGVLAAVAAFALMYQNSESFRESVGGLVEAVGGLLVNAFSVIKGVIDAVWPSVQRLFRVLGDMLSPVISALTPIVWALNNVLSAVGTVFGAALPVAIDVATKALNFIKPIFSVVGGVIKALATVVKALAKDFSNIFTCIVNVVQAARDKIKGAIDKIKSFFKITLKFQGIKLPHLDITWKKSGAIAKIASKLGLPGVPHFGVSWYKTGGIFDSPSVIGVGEAGPEAVIPLDKLRGFIRDSIPTQLGDNRGPSGQVIIENVIKLDKKVIARETAPLIDLSLGQMSTLSARGV